MASFSEIFGMAQQGQEMPGAPMPYVPGMPAMQSAMQMPAADIQQMPAPTAETQAPQAAPEQTPPATPQEFEQRKQAWGGVLQGILAQPNAKEMMMLVAMQLMKGRRPGQSVGSQFMEAAGTGMMANQMYKHNQIEDAQKQKAQEREDQRFGVEMRRGTAQADKAEAENDFYSKTRAQALDEINIGIDNLKRRGKLDDAKLVEQEFENGNLKKAWDLAVAEKETAIADRKHSMWARGAQVKISQQNANKVPAAGQAKKDTEDLVRRANPIMPGETPAAYDQRIAQATLGIQTTSKTNSAADLLKLAELTEDDTERAAILAEVASGVRGRSLGSGPGRAAVANPKADWIKRAQAANPGMPLAEIQQRANAKFGK